MAWHSYVHRQRETADRASSALDAALAMYVRAARIRRSAPISPARLLDLRHFHCSPQPYSSLLPPTPTPSAFLTSLARRPAPMRVMRSLSQVTHYTHPLRRNPCNYVTPLSLPFPVPLRPFTIPKQLRDTPTTLGICKIHNDMATEHPASAATHPARLASAIPGNGK